jgi:hypothetical protein
MLSWTISPVEGGLKTGDHADAAIRNHSTACTTTLGKQTVGPRIEQARGPRWCDAVDAGNGVRLSNREGMIPGLYPMGGAVDTARRAVTNRQKLRAKHSTALRGIDCKLPGTA